MSTSEVKSRFRGRGCTDMIGGRPLAEVLAEFERRFDAALQVQALRLQVNDEQHPDGDVEHQRPDLLGGAGLRVDHAL